MKNIKYITSGRESNNVFVIKGVFNTQQEALDLANELNSKQSIFYYDYSEVDITKEHIRIQLHNWLCETDKDYAKAVDKQLRKDLKKYVPKGSIIKII